MVFGPFILVLYVRFAQLAERVCPTVHSGLFKGRLVNQPIFDEIDKTIILFFIWFRSLIELARHQAFICDFTPAATSRLFLRMPGYKVRQSGLSFYQNPNYHLILTNYFKDPVQIIHLIILSRWRLDVVCMLGGPSKGRLEVIARWMRLTCPLMSASRSS